MSAYISDVAFTLAVKEQQERLGSRNAYARMEQKRGWSATISDDLAEFIATRNSFYLGTASAEGQPYIQHRGGPAGFLRVLDGRTLAFADFGGNKQYISTGNLSENGRAFIFLMDYANRRRIKIWGRARYVEDDASLIERLADPGYGAKVERAIVFEVAAWDVNCPQHIPELLPAEETSQVVERLQDRIAELEAELAARSETLPAVA